MSDDNAPRLMALFSGYDKVHGTHGLPDKPDGRGKCSIKKTAKTLTTGPTLELWAKHLSGERPLGVVPIMSDSTCMWGCIDVDDYTLDTLEVIARVESMKLPVVPCRSKSGGLHLFLFCSEPVGAELMQSALRSMATAIGFAGSEIFPKQTRILADQGDSGNWMAMPYYGDTFGGKLKFQYGLKKTGAEMTLDEFIRVAESKRVTARELQVYEKAGQTPRPQARRVNLVNLPPDQPFGNGPPCLQIMSQSGFPEGGRNNALFHVGVYLKKAFPDAWKQMLADKNQKYMRPPLPVEEVLQVQKQLDKKEYRYKCRDQPMTQHCDKVSCLGREFGVGDGAEIPVITHIRVVQSDDPIWYLSLKGGNGELQITDARDLTDFKRFRNQCVRQLGVTFHLLSDDNWTAIYRAALEGASVEDAPADLTALGEFQGLLGNYLTNRQRGSSREDLLRDVGWENEAQQRYEFTMVGLAKHLRQEGLKFTRQQPGEWIRALGGGPLNEHNGGVTKVKGRSMRIWWVPSSAVEKTPDIAPPPLPPEPI